MATRTFKTQHGEEYRIYPSTEAQHYFHCNFGCSRKMYNLRVAQITDEQTAYFTYKDEHDGSPIGFNYHWITEKEAKQEYEYMKDVLCVRGMLKTHFLARGISDAGWGTFLTYCQYKCEWAGKEFVKIDRFFPSTQLCSVCFEKVGPKGLSGLGARSWVCPECGAEFDRDLNAAWNILFDGLRVLGGSDVRWFRVLSRVRSWYVASVMGCCADGTSVKSLGVSADGVGFAVGTEAGMYTVKQPSVSSGGNAVAGCGLGEPAVSKKKNCVISYASVGA